MRVVSILIAGTVLASCSTVEPPRSAQRQQHFQQLIAGKAASAPVSCVPHYNARGMSVVDGRTLAFRTSARSAYVVHLTQGCSALASPGYTLLTRQYGGMGLCRGDIARVVDLTTQVMAGSCAISAVIPYTRPA